MWLANLRLNDRGLEIADYTTVRLMVNSTTSGFSAVADKYNKPPPPGEHRLFAAMRSAADRAGLSWGRYIWR